MAFDVLPARVEGALGDRPGIRFDGETNMVLPDADLLGVADFDYEIVIVARSSAPGLQYLIGGDQPDGDQLALCINGTAGAGFLPTMAAQPVSAQWNESGAYADGLPHVFGVRVESGLGYLRVDGWQSPDVVSFATGFEETGLLLGSAGDPLHRFQGDIAEVLVYSSSLGADQRLQLEQHLAGAWGVVLVPEPSGAMLAAAAALSLLAWRTRKRKLPC